MKGFLRKAFKGRDRTPRSERPGTTSPPPDHQVAAVELYHYRLRHRGASLETTAADMGRPAATLERWVNESWRWPRR
ncbi:hypothetical protein [Streptomyces alboflavus]|uniref:hypothetical protein n=1 Tax=Streptomyces alboflavus TaxID=67267 RepID=UPI0036935AC0